MALAPTDCFVRNMAALRAFQPDIATVVDATPIPEGLTPAVGRDGSDTYRCRGEDGRPAWFGGSSMPTVSAGELLGGFASDGQNVTLPGVLTGLEPLIVASRLPAHCALFVTEPDPVNLAVALHLHDYTALMATGRLAFVLGQGGELEKGFVAFFDRFSGYDLPTHLISAPQQSAADLADLTDRLESAGRTVAAMQAQRLQAQAETLRARRFGPLPATPRVAVIGVNPHPESLEQAQRVSRTLSGLQWPFEVCVPDAPGKCHTVARMQAVNKVRADVVLLIDSPIDTADGLWPETMTVLSWYPCDAPPHELPETGDPSHRITFVSPDAPPDSSRDRGFVAPCAPAADPTVYRPVRLGPTQRSTLGVDVAVLMDVPDDRPEMCGVTLASHVSLWQHLQATVEKALSDDRMAKPGAVLEQAQGDSGVLLQDASSREHFEELVRTRIIPAALAKTTAEALIAEGRSVGVWGCNWPAQASVRRGAIPTPTERNRIFNAAGLVLFPSLRGTSLQTALDARAAGAAVVCRSEEASFRRRFPTLGELVDELHLYETISELRDRVRTIAAAAERETAGLRIASERVLNGHTVAHRLREIVALVRRRQEAEVEQPV